MRKLLLVAGMLALAACDSDKNKPDVSIAPAAKEAKTVASNPVGTRGNSAEQVAEGQAVFENNCLVCHGQNGVGETEAWQVAREDGTFPAPPLNGTAHTWHHNAKVLLGTIDRGGIPLGGRMPPFKDVLSDDEKIAVLAYIKSLWPDEVYQIWLKNNG